MAFLGEEEFLVLEKNEESYEIIRRIPSRRGGRPQGGEGL